MYWILATVFIVIALAIPRLRPLGAVGCLVLAAMLGWGVVQRLRGSDPQQPRALEQRGRPSSPGVQLRSVPLSQVAAENLHLSGDGAPFELRGRIVNRSQELALRSVTIRLTRRDCYEGAVDPTGCVRVWQDERWIAISVPPAQARDFMDVIWMHGNAPQTRGVSRDSFELIAAVGERSPDVER